MTEPAPISVVIPAYNAGDFLRDAIESVQRQNLPVAEVIVVDDGSTDHTSRIAEGLGAKVIRQTNRGVSAARNTGIQAARNEWIAFIDQDDLWLPEKIESQWRAVELHRDVGVVTCHMSWFEDESVSPRSNQADSGLDATNEDDDGSVAYVHRVRKGFPLSRMLDYTSSILIRRDLLLCVGMFDEHLRQNEDLECFLRVIAHSPLAIVRKRLVRRRIHTKNVSLNDPAGAAASYREILELLCAQPNKYPAGAARAYNRSFSRRLILNGRTLMDEGKVREARQAFARSMGKHFSARAMLLWCATFLGQAGFQSLVSIKRRLS